MLKIGFIVVVVLLAAVLATAATRPDSFRVQRTARVEAPPERVFELVGDFRSWAAWSPYEKLDPGMKRVVSGVASGQGAVYEWDGNDQVGKGRMEITEASGASRIVIKLDFFRPFEAHNVAEFTLQARGDATEITWAMHGPSPYLAKLMGLFVSMDKLVGKDFEAGLANLKAVAER